MECGLTTLAYTNLMYLVPELDKTPTPLKDQQSGCLVSQLYVSYTHGNVLPLLPVVVG
jgi:hypothetical protein